MEPVNNMYSRLLTSNLTIYIRRVRVRRAKHGADM